MIEPNWLSPQAVITIHDHIIATHGGLSGFKNGETAFLAVLDAPRNCWDYAEAGAKPTLPELAAEYAFRFATGHAFNDANKRTALMAMLMFLWENDCFVDIEDQMEADAMTYVLATKAIDRKVYAAWLQRYVP